MCAVCTVESQKPLEKEIVMVETPSDDMLPAGLFILPVVLPSSAVEENKFKVLIKNETCKEVTIPSGTVVAHVFPTDTVTVASVTPTLCQKLLCDCATLDRTHQRVSSSERGWKDHH